MKHFTVAVVGASGGCRESNLSSYLVARKKDDNFIAFDAGTLLSGMTKVVKKRKMKIEESGSSLELSLLHHIRAFLISHPHLDHLAGLIIASQIDTPKTLYGLPFTIDAIAAHLFNGIIWPNYGSEGENAKGLYSYCRLEEKKQAPLTNTTMQVEPFIISHGKDLLSTAFLLESEGKYLLYCGDMAADQVTGKENNRKLWERIAPLVQKKKLRGLFMECSYATPEITCHLTPDLFMKEMETLKTLSGCELTDLPLIVTHRKEQFEEKNEMPKRIAEELEKKNQLRLNLIFPTQGDVFTL